MEIDTINIEFPFLPPSVNACYRSYKGRVIKSAKLKEFEQLMIQHFASLDREYTMMQGELRLTITFYLPNRRNGDIDNFCKAMLDGLEGRLFENDKMIYELNLKKYLNTGVSKTIIKLESLG